MKRFDVKRVGRLLSELVVLLALYFLGCQLAAWWHLPIPGGVVGMALLPDRHGEGHCYRTQHQH